MAKKRASLLNAFNAALPKRVEPPRVAPPDPSRTVPQRTVEPPSQARADRALPVRVAPPAPAIVRRAGTHADLPAPPPPYARGRMLLLSIVGATVLLIVVIVIKSSAKNGGENDGVALAGAPNAATSAPKSAPQSEPAAPKNTKAALDPTAGSTDDDKLFLDTRNKFTVRLAQYNNDATGVKAARDAYRHLRKEGIPAVQPIESGDARYIFLCADAKPKKDDLNGLCAYLKRLPGPDRKSTPFDDAYIDNIEKLIQR